MTRVVRKHRYSLFPGQSSGWVARGSVQTLSQMNGCHVPGNRSHTEPGLQANWQIFPFPSFRRTTWNHRGNAFMCRRSRSRQPAAKRRRKTAVS